MVPSEVDRDLFGLFAALFHGLDDVLDSFACEVAVVEVELDGC